MTNRLETLEDWAAGLLGQLEPASRNKLARSIGQALRRSQQQRIIAQENPDGSKYTPRKRRNLRNKQGRVKQKGKMFQKLRTSRYIKVQCDSNTISVGFTGRIARIARVHQYGLKDRAGRGVTEVKYFQREVLGLTKQNSDFIKAYLLSNLTRQ
ncbi:phage virion morphogenesis protein [Pseudomonas sp. TNT2022 ID1044]|uniref:phage virion morphogenesis protein n=1 Tax=Pseudomonas sp. TNT2022 ID1044 TaxID=2942636 RepID=UPI00236108B6|nr:phage virion morphogenesis protein [Pseudomonas sp. TNT2022 ID1044]MDD0998474.1 phage virion morphogenesis protein [Pseudomonas sp. TNT2022 ID1044]